jgi:hypothetical protein
MTSLGKHCTIMCLLGAACLIGSAEARAQSRDDAQKRAFAELLARRAKASEAESRREIAAADRAERRTVETTRVARSTRVHHGHGFSTSPQFATVSRVVANAAGTAPATPVMPSGFGAGRDAYIEALYPGMLGRDVTQSDLDYWSGVLASGRSPNVVATLIWRSPEHRALLRTHTSPGVPYNIAYRYALFIGDKVGHP